MKANPRRTNGFIFFVAALLAFAILSGCQSGPTKPAAGRMEMDLKRIAVLPVSNMHAIYGDGVNFRCPLSGRAFIVGAVAPDAEAYLTGQVYSILRRRENVHVISPDRAVGAQSKVLRDSPEAMCGAPELMQIAQSLDADAVLVGRVYRFVQRTGTNYFARSPASVSFSLLLVDARQGNLLWEGHFTETQRSLSENLLKIGAFFKRKMRWLTAEELAVYGIEEVFRSFPVK